VPVRDARALADAIAGLAEDAPSRQAMGAAGRALAEREFDVERVARIQVELYDELSRVSGTRTGRS
jgi:glycosyltransferase involved in cell wall biosynthesis